VWCESGVDSEKLRYVRVYTIKAPLLAIALHIWLQYILCWVYALFFFFLVQFRWTVHFWLPLQFFIFLGITGLWLSMISSFISVVGVYIGLSNHYEMCSSKVWYIVSLNPSIGNITLNSYGFCWGLCQAMGKVGFMLCFSSSCFSFIFDCPFSSSSFWGSQAYDCPWFPLS
jgi:hypothetical protein